MHLWKVSLTCSGMSRWRRPDHLAPSGSRKPHVGGSGPASASLVPLANHRRQSRKGLGYDEALGRAETEAYQRFVARLSSGKGRPIAFAAKSIVTKAVMSATEKRSPAP